MAVNLVPGYAAPMKRRRFLGSLIGLAAVAHAQDEITLDDLLDQGREWVEENLDERVLEVVDQIDVDEVKRVLHQIQERLGGEYVLDLAAIRETAAGLVPLLEKDESTAPFADWLRSRLDYLEVAEELNAQTPVPEPKPGEPPAPRSNPPAERERRAWRKKVGQKPSPKGGEALAKQLKPVFIAEKVPGELVWLAEVESSFNPKAKSPVGAAGLFQLMPDTARSLGLSLFPRDERLVPEKNARAAARYLRYLFERFKDWPLALAAYNCGEGRLRRLLDKHGATTFDMVSPYLPAETQMYVPKFEAILRRRENKELTSLTLPGGEQ
jgi:membrane-bound lytic murein transglycosylase D